MLFWFSGTGNSEQVSKRLEKQFNERRISIQEAYHQQAFEYTLKGNEKLGFVFPVYYYGLPKIVDEFLKVLKIHHHGNHYVYAIITCGGSSGSCTRMLQERLKEKGLELKLSYDLVMVDNYILMYDVPSLDKQAQILADAKEQLIKIMDKISQQEVHIHIPLKDKLLGKMLYKGYDMQRKTLKFNVNDACISCGKCVSLCPDKAIVLKEGKPVWIKEKCNHCLACIHRCPTQAINYGHKTIKRHRYSCKEDL